MTWDADVAPDARTVFLNQATFEGMGRTMVDMMVRDAGTSDGEFLIVTAVLTAPNQNRWIDEIKKYAAEKYPGHEDRGGASRRRGPREEQERRAQLSPGQPADQGHLLRDRHRHARCAGSRQAARPHRQSDGDRPRRAEPDPAVPQGRLAKEAALWSPIDIGYGAVYITKALLDGKLDPASGYVEAGRLGKLKFIAPDTVLLGDPFIFTKDNVDQFDF